MDIKRVVIIGTLALLLIFVLTQLYFINKEGNKLEAQIFSESQKLFQLKKENQEIQEDIDYYSFPENVVKALKEKFNYKNPGEKMMIVVPDDKKTNN